MINLVSFIAGIITGTICFWIGWYFGYRTGKLTK